MEIVESYKNDKVKDLRKLYKKKYRRQNKKYILEGLRLIRGSFKANATIERIYLTKRFYNRYSKENLLKENINKLIFVTEDIIKNVADTINPQEIIAVVKEPQSRLKEVLSKDLILIIDQIQNPGNLGTIIRTAVAAGFQSMIITKGSVDLYNLKVIRSTTGAIYSIPFIKDIELKDLKDKLKSFSHKIITADLDTKKIYNEINYTKPLGLIIGNEARGISKDLLEIADIKVKIPIRGDLDSLNAGIAAGILMYKITENLTNVE